MNTKSQTKKNGGWIGLLFLIHFFVLAIAKDSDFYFNIILSVYCVLLSICVTYNIVTDFLEIKNNDKLLNLKKEKKHLFLPYLLLLIVKNIGRYFFFGITAFLFYCFSTKDLSLIRNMSLSAIALLIPFLILSVLLPFVFNPKTKNNEFTSYYWGACLGNAFTMFLLSISNVDIDDLVRQKQEQLINHYMQLCTKQKCNETLYFSQKDNNNMFSQKYRVRVFHNIDNEKCVSIMNTYFDPHLNIGKCENEKDKTDESSATIQDN